MSQTNRERAEINSLESDYSVDDSGAACIDIGIKRTLCRGCVCVCLFFCVLHSMNKSKTPNGFRS